MKANRKYSRYIYNIYVNFIITNLNIKNEPTVIAGLIQKVFNLKVFKAKLWTICFRIIAIPLP